MTLNCCVDTLLHELHEDSVGKNNKLLKIHLVITVSQFPIKTPKKKLLISFTRNFFANNIFIKRKIDSSKSFSCKFDLI